jgi:hypothetical protein
MAYILLWERKRSNDSCGSHIPNPSRALISQGDKIFPIRAAKQASRCVSITSLEIEEKYINSFFTFFPLDLASSKVKISYAC